MATIKLTIEDPVKGTATTYFDSETGEIIKQYGQINAPYLTDWKNLLKGFKASFRDNYTDATLDIEIKEKIQPWLDIPEKGYDRELVRLLCEEGLTYKEISGRLGVSPERLMNRVSDLRHKEHYSIPTQAENRKIFRDKSRDIV